jgi:hypothetical protein
MAEALKLTLRQRRERVRCSKGRKRAFLATLAETCDIAKACAAATLDWIGITQLRAMDPQFAADWEAVIAATYARLEMEALKEAGAAGDRKIDLALARELLKQRGAAAARKGGPAKPPPPTIRDREQSMADFMRPFRDPGVPGQAKDDHGPDGKLAALVADAEGGRRSGYQAAASIAG